MSHAPDGLDKLKDELIEQWQDSTLKCEIQVSKLVAENKALKSRIQELERQLAEAVAASARGAAGKST